MGSRLAILAIVVEDLSVTDQMNAVLHEYKDYIIGRTRQNTSALSVLQSTRRRKRSARLAESSAVSAVLPSKQPTPASEKSPESSTVLQKVLQEPERTKNMKQKELLKKFTAAAAAAVMTIALSACAADASAGNTAKEAAASETTVIASTTAAQETGAAETTLETPAAASTTDTAAGSQTDAVRVGSLKGPTTMGIVNLRKASEDGTSEGSYIFTMATQPDEIAADIAGGKLDIAMVPANLASVLYNKTKGGVSVVDINTLGVIYCVSGNTEIHSVKDLAGKTVLSTGQGATPEYALSYLLEKNGVTDCKIEFKSEATEIAAALNADPQQIAVLPQPFVTVAEAKNPELKTAFSLSDEWDNVSKDGSHMVTGVTIVRNEFLKDHPDAVSVFLKEHAASAEKAVSDIDTTAGLVAQYGIIEKTPVAAKALPYCNIVCIAGDEMKTALSGYLQVLYDANPKSVGGALPADDFYYTGK